MKNADSSMVNFTSNKNHRSLLTSHDFKLSLLVHRWFSGATARFSMCHAHLGVGQLDLFGQRGQLLEIHALVEAAVHHLKRGTGRAKGLLGGEGWQWSFHG